MSKSEAKTAAPPASKSSDLPSLYKDAPPSSKATGMFFNSVRAYEDGTTVLAPFLVDSSEIAYTKREFSEKGALNKWFSAAKAAKLDKVDDKGLWNLIAVTSITFRSGLDYFPIMICSKKTMDSLKEQTDKLGLDFSVFERDGPLCRTLCGKFLGRANPIEPSHEKKKLDEVSDMFGTMSWLLDLATVEQSPTQLYTVQPGPQSRISEFPLVVWHHWSWLLQLYTLFDPAIKTSDQLIKAWFSTDRTPLTAAERKHVESCVEGDRKRVTEALKKSRIAHAYFKPEENRVMAVFSTSILGADEPCLYLVDTGSPHMLVPKGRLKAFKKEKEKEKEKDSASSTRAPKRKQPGESSSESVSKPDVSKKQKIDKSSSELDGKHVSTPNGTGTVTSTSEKTMAKTKPGKTRPVPVERKNAIEAIKRQNKLPVPPLKKDDESLPVPSAPDYHGTGSATTSSSSSSLSTPVSVSEPGAKQKKESSVQPMSVDADGEQSIYAFVEFENQKRLAEFCEKVKKDTKRAIEDECQHRARVGISNLARIAERFLAGKDINKVKDLDRFQKEALSVLYSGVSIADVPQAQAKTANAMVQALLMSSTRVPDLPGSTDGGSKTSS